MHVSPIFGGHAVCLVAAHFVKICNYILVFLWSDSIWCKLLVEITKSG